MNEEDLQDLAAEYVDMHTSQPVAKSVYVSWITGHCHTCSKQAIKILEEMKSCGLISVRKDVVYPL